MSKVYVMMENDNPVGVTHSKTKAEQWLFTPENDYLTFDMEDTLKPEDKAPGAPTTEYLNTPQERLMRNVDKLDTGLSEADKGLRETVQRLQKKFKPKSSLLSRTGSKWFKDPALEKEEPRGGPQNGWAGNRSETGTVVREMLDAGVPLREIVEETGMNATYVSRLKQEMREEQRHGYHVRV